MSVAELWANLVQAHAGLNWMALLPFYGILAMAGLFAALMIRLVRRAGRASEAAGRVRALEQEIKQLRSLESQTRQLRSDTGALQAQLDKGYQSLREHMATQKQALKNEIQELERDVRRELEEVERTVTEELADIWRHKLFPLLEEYFYNDCRTLRETVFENTTSLFDEETQSFDSLSTSDLTEALVQFVDQYDSEQAD